MTGLLSSLTQIALLRKDPSGLPSSWALVAVFVILYAAVDVMIILLVTGYRAFARTALDVGFALAFIGLVLALTGRARRLPQSLIAVFGAYVLLAPAIAILLLTRAAAKSNEAIALLTAAGAVLVALWYLLIVGHVLRSALDTGLVTGFALTVTWTVANFALSQALFGSAP